MATERIDVSAVLANVQDIHERIARVFPDMDSPESVVADLKKARAAVAELIEADHEYEAARRDWDHVTAHDPEETSDETWRQVADRYEAAVMRRAAALARVGGA